MLFDIDNPVTAVLADDHEVVRTGIKRMLSVDKRIRILADASNGEDVIKLVEYHKPIVVLLDILMPKKSGIEAVSEIKTISPTSYIVMLTAFEDSEHLEQALEAGADGYLTKDISAKDLIDSIFLVTQGERVFSKTIINILQNSYIPKQVETPQQVSITKREQQILNLVADGMTSNQIAEKIGLSPRTVESHRYNIMQKLGIKRATSLVKFAVNHSVIEN